MGSQDIANFILFLIETNQLPADLASIIQQGAQEELAARNKTLQTDKDHGSSYTPHRQSLYTTPAVLIRQPGSPYKPPQQSLCATPAVLIRTGPGPVFFAPDLLILALDLFIFALDLFILALSVFIFALDLFIFALDLFIMALDLFMFVGRPTHSCTKTGILLANPISSVVRF